MVGAIATNLHEGSRSEYLAQYIFASFGTAVAVPHHEDTGVDLYCTLTEAIGSRSWPRAYFSVQVKSTMDPWIFDGAESVRWLVEHPLPLFLCAVDKSQARLRVYHTSPRFYIWAMPPLPARLELVPTIETEGVCTQWEGSNTFSLSAPIVDATIQEFLQDAFRQRILQSLGVWIDVAIANLRRLKSGIHSFRMPAKYSPNGPAHGGIVDQGILSAPSIDGALAHAKELCAYLATQLYRRRDVSGAARCALFLRHFFPDDTSGATHDVGLHNAINKVVRRTGDYMFSGVDTLNAEVDQMLTGRTG